MTETTWETVLDSLNGREEVVGLLALDETGLPLAGNILHHRIFISLTSI